MKWEQFNTDNPDDDMTEIIGKCPKCNKELVKWYCCAGGMIYLGCSDILCEYKKEIKE